MPHLGKKDTHPPQIVEAIQKELLSPLPPTYKDLSVKYGVNIPNVCRLKKRLSININCHKKNILLASEMERFQAGAKLGLLEALSILRSPEKLKKCSSPQLAMICGILFDKLKTFEDKNNIERISMRLETSQEMIKFLESGDGEGPPSNPSPPPSLPDSLLSQIKNIKPEKVEIEGDKKI